MPCVEENEIVPLCQTVKRSVLIYSLDDSGHFGKQKDNVNLAVRQQMQIYLLEMLNETLIPKMRGIFMADAVLLGKKRGPVMGCLGRRSLSQINVNLVNTMHHQLT